MKPTRKTVKTAKKAARRCRCCGAPERRDKLGLYSTLTPYSGICADCINRAMR
jgi:hypothetical protein